jgi:predicted nucleic acid-binding protein
VIVLDASAAVDLLLQIEPQASAVSGWVTGQGKPLHVPFLFDEEVVQTLRRRNLQRELSSDRAQEALDDLQEMRLLRYPLAPLITRIWELRANMSVFDAAYVVLAETLEAVLVTCDRKLGRATGHQATIQVVS